MQRVEGGDVDDASNNSDEASGGGHFLLHPQAGLADEDKGQSRFDSPRGLTVSNAGNVYVKDTNTTLYESLTDGETPKL